MSTSALERDDAGAMAPLHYFADYEVSIGGRFLAWGQATTTYPMDDTTGFDPAVLLNRLRQQAADEHGVERSDVRIRNLCKL